MIIHNYMYLHKWLQTIIIFKYINIKIFMFDQIGIIFLVNHSY